MYLRTESVKRVQALAWSSDRERAVAEKGAATEKANLVNGGEGSERAMAASMYSNTKQDYFEEERLL